MKKLGKILGLVAIVAIGAVSLAACSGGQKVTEDIWKAALDAKFTQGTATTIESGKEDGVTVSYSSTVKMTADKMQMAMTEKIGDKEETEESYAAKEGDKYYAYSKVDGKWKKTEIPKEAFEATSAGKISDMIKGMTGGEVKFADFKFEKGAYTYTKDDTTVSIVFKSKKVASVKVVEGKGDDQTVSEFKLDYGKPSITLPKVG